MIKTTHNTPLVYAFSEKTRSRTYLDDVSYNEGFTCGDKNHDELTNMRIKQA